MEVEAVDEGVLGKILVQDGGTEGVKVNEPIAMVDQAEAVPAAAPGGSSARGSRPPCAKCPPKRPRGEAANSPPRPAAPSGTGTDEGGERIFVSPLARRMAKQAGNRSRGAEGQRAERTDRQG